MASNFPTSLDNFPNPTPTSPRSSPSLSGAQADQNDAIEALEAKVGVNGSAVTTSLDYKVATLNTQMGTHTHAPKYEVLTVRTGTQAYSSTTGESALLAGVIAGGTLAASDIIRMRAWGRILGNNTGAATNWVWRIRFGASIIHQTPNIAYGDSSIQRAWIVDFSMVIQTTTAQASEVTQLVTATGQDGAGWAAFGTSETFLGYGNATENTAIDRTLQLTVQMDQSSANDYTDCRGGWIEVASL